MTHNTEDSTVPHAAQQMTNLNLRDGDQGDNGSPTIKYLDRLKGLDSEAFFTGATMKQTMHDGLLKFTGFGEETWILNPALYAGEEYDKNLRERPKTVKIMFLGSNPDENYLTGMSLAQLNDGHPMAKDVLKWMVGERDLLCFRNTRQYRLFSVLWKYIDKEIYLDHCILINYCPLTMVKVKMDEPTKVFYDRCKLSDCFMAAEDRQTCKVALQEIVSAWNPQLIVAIGDEVYSRAQRVISDGGNNGSKLICIRDPHEYRHREEMPLWEKHLEETLFKEKTWKEVIILSVQMNLVENLRRNLKSPLKGHDFLKFPISKDRCVAEVFNPLHYARKLLEKYVQQIPQKTRILFIGLAPCPDSPTGIPFFSSESGVRFWRYVKEKFVSQQIFFRHCFVINFCPIYFLDQNRNNVSLLDVPNPPDRWVEMELSCRAALKDIINILQPEMIVGISKYAVLRVNELGLDMPGEPLYMHDPNKRENATYDDWIRNLKNDKDGLETNKRWQDMVKAICHEETEE